MGDEMKPMHAYAIVHNDKLQGLAPDGTLFPAKVLGAVLFFWTLEEGESILEACAPWTTRKDYQVIQVVLEEY